MATAARTQRAVAGAMAQEDGERAASALAGARERIGRLARDGGGADNAVVAAREAEDWGAAERPAQQHEGLRAVVLGQVVHGGFGVVNARLRARGVPVVEAERGDARRKCG